MTPEMLKSLRYRFETGNGPITMGELDLLLRYAEESHKYLAELEAWLKARPGAERGL